MFYVDELAQVLECKFSEHGEPLLFLLYGKNTYSGNYSKPASFEVCDTKYIISHTIMKQVTMLSLVVFPHTITGKHNHSCYISLPCSFELQCLVL